VTVHFNKARDRWMFDFQSGKERHQGYCLDAEGKPVTSRSAAKVAEAVARRQIAIAPKLVRGKDTTLALVMASMQTQWQREADWPNKQRYGRELLTFFGAATPVADIHLQRIREYIDFAQAQPIRVWKGAAKMDRNAPGAAHYWKDTGKTRSPATVNRYLAMLRSILARAAEMRDPVSHEPVIAFVPKFEDLPEPKRRARPTPEPVLQRLMQILPPHAVDAMVITLFFGFRRGEAFGLREDQIDWHAQGIRFYAEDVKDDEDAFQPGSQEAMGYLRVLAMDVEAKGILDLDGRRPIIVYRRNEKDPFRPIKNAKRAWKTAMRVVAREFGRTWRWHDLRAAFITHVAMTSGPVAAQTMARHSSFDTTRGYIEVADEMSRLAAERVAERPSLRLVGGKVPNRNP
jgi:integrase